MFCDWPHLGRCCFCMPLRRGILTCAYINLFLSAYMLGMYSYIVHKGSMADKVVNVVATFSIMPAEVCIVFYCLEIVFNAVLIYGAHKKLLKYVQVFYYYTIVTCVALLVVQIVDVFSSHGPSIIEQSIFAFAGVCLQIYLITLVRSLLQNLQVSGPHTYENQLHSIATGEMNVESGILKDTTAIPIDAWD